MVFTCGSTSFGHLRRHLRSSLRFGRSSSSWWFRAHHGVFPVGWDVCLRRIGDDGGHLLPQQLAEEAALPFRGGCPGGAGGRSQGVCVEPFGEQHHKSDCCTWAAARWRWLKMVMFCIILYPKIQDQDVHVWWSDLWKKNLFPDVLFCPAVFFRP